MRTLLIALLVASTAVAQSYRGSGHVFYAPTIYTSGSRPEPAQGFGFGGEAFVYKGLAAGADLGWFWPGKTFQDGIGVLSVNPSYHFRGRENGRRIVPFVTGGYGMFFREGSLNVPNVGGGVTAWIWRRAGLRFEVRDHFEPRDEFHVISFRMGLSFR